MTWYSEKKLKEVVKRPGDIKKESQGIFKVIDLYSACKEYLVEFNSESYRVKVSGNEKIDENVNDYLIKHKKDLSVPKKKIDIEKILKNYDVFEEVNRPSQKGHKQGTKVTIRLGRIIS
jgi:hypothetical protein